MKNLRKQIQDCEAQEILMILERDSIKNRYDAARARIEALQIQLKQLECSAAEKGLLLSQKSYANLSIVTLKEALDIVLMQISEYSSEIDSSEIALIALRNKISVLQKSLLNESVMQDDDEALAEALALSLRSNVPEDDRSILPVGDVFSELLDPELQSGLQIAASFSSAPKNHEKSELPVAIDAQDNDLQAALAMSLMPSSETSAQSPEIAKKRARVEELRKNLQEARKKAQDAQDRLLALQKKEEEDIEAVFQRDMCNGIAESLNGNSLGDQVSSESYERPNAMSQIEDIQSYEGIILLNENLPLQPILQVMNSWIASWTANNQPQSLWSAEISQLPGLPLNEALTMLHALQEDEETRELHSASQSTSSVSLTLPPQHVLQSLQLWLETAQVSGTLPLTQALNTLSTLLHSVENHSSQECADEESDDLSSLAKDLPVEGGGDLSALLAKRSELQQMTLHLEHLKELLAMRQQTLKKMMISKSADDDAALEHAIKLSLLEQSSQISQSVINTGNIGQSILPVAGVDQELHEAIALSLMQSSEAVSTLAEAAALANQDIGSQVERNTTSHNTTLDLELNDSILLSHILAASHLVSQ